MKLTNLSFLILFVSVIFTASVQMSFVNMEDVDTISIVEEEKHEEDSENDEANKALGDFFFDYKVSALASKSLFKQKSEYLFNEYELVLLGVPYSPPEV